MQVMTLCISQAHSLIRRGAVPAEIIIALVNVERDTEDEPIGTWKIFA
jgi:hypothetical protein